MNAKKSGAQWNICDMVCVINSARFHLPSTFPSGLKLTSLAKCGGEQNCLSGKTAANGNGIPDSLVRPQPSILILNEAPEYDWFFVLSTSLLVSNCFGSGCGLASGAKTSSFGMFVCFLLLFSTQHFCRRWCFSVCFHIKLQKCCCIKILLSDFTSICAQYSSIKKTYSLQSRYYFMWFPNTIYIEMPMHIKLQGFSSHFKEICSSCDVGKSILFQLKQWTYQTTFINSNNIRAVKVT